MEKIAELKKNSGKKGHEALFCWLMICFILFEAFLVTVLLIRSLAAPTAGDDPPSHDGESTTDGTAPIDPPVDLPVFTDADIPALPTATAATKTISGIHSKYAVLVNAKTGEIVAQSDADTRFEPASLTKVMTLIVACENLKESDLDRKLVLTQEIWDYVRSGDYLESSVAGHDVNDEVKIKDLLYGIGMESAADCTMMIAQEIAGSEEAFVALMNRKAEALELSNTHFDNAIGHESEQNYTTAREMAVIMMYAMQSDLIADILGLTQHVFNASYYDDAGVYQDFRFTYYSTLFRSRMDTYKKYAGKDFSLTTAKLKAGKTGSFITSSYVVCAANGLQSGTQYILVLGDAPKEGTVPASYGTMCDVKTVLDTYAK